ncbi:MAG: LysR family transcriptional regulator, partial [Woeseiaceae bacterium]
MPSKPKISLRGLRTFSVAARYESFRTAAEELFITASAVSHQIKSLEEELGEQLFDRNSRTLS